jgi:hypothetical protein
MHRWPLILGCVFALALAAPLGFQAEAAKAKGKNCVGTRMDGKQSRWQCRPAQKCCFDAVVGKGSCTSGACSFW